jgi:hypothetical protein
MKAIFSSFTVLSALYDFSIDGGAIGSIDLGIVIPQNSIITRCLFRTWDTAVSGGGGAATIAFQKRTGAVVSAGFFGVAQPAGNFVAGGVLSGVDFNATPTLAGGATFSTIELVIAADVLTAGKIQVILNFQQTDQL